jgi:RNA polymerase sigma-70 factor (ECF subfamily)
MVRQLQRERSSRVHLSRVVFEKNQDAPAEDLDRWMTAARETGDREAFTQVVNASHHFLRAMILRKSADPELADEIAQDTLVRAWAKRHQYRPGTNPRNWLFTIARSQLTEHHRRQDRARRHLRDLIKKELLRQAANSPTDPDVDELRLAALKTCIDELREDHRQLIDFVYGQGLTTGATAKILGIKPLTCRKRLSRLQRSLRECAENRLKTLA